MPTTAIKHKYEMPRLEDDCFATIPSWAQPKFRQTEKLFLQLTEQIVQLEINIADLQNRRTKEDWPKSIQVNVEVKVKEAQQAQVDSILSNAKKAFCDTVLLGLIGARQAELAQLRSDLVKVPEDFVKFIEDTIRELNDSEIPVLEKDMELYELSGTVRKIITDHTDNIDTTYRTFQFLSHKEQLKKQEARQAEKEQRRIDMELDDPVISRLQNRLEKVEKHLKIR